MPAVPVAIDSRITHIDTPRLRLRRWTRLDQPAFAAMNADADVNHFKIPDELSDEKTLFLGDVLSTGYMAAENCNIQAGDTVAVWGAGPVGLFSMQCALMLGARRVVAMMSTATRGCVRCTRAAAGAAR